jgi:hypothetical protein
MVDGVTQFQHTLWFSMHQGLLTAKNNAIPKMCVKIMILKVTRTGRRLLLQGAASDPFDPLSFSIASRVHAASDQSFSPPNIIATLTRTALGRKYPILRNLSGSAIM